MKSRPGRKQYIAVPMSTEEHEAFKAKASEANLDMSQLARRSMGLDGDGTSQAITVKSLIGQVIRNGERTLVIEWPNILPPNDGMDGLPAALRSLRKDIDAALDHFADIGYKGGTAFMMARKSNKPALVDNTDLGEDFSNRPHVVRILSGIRNTGLFPDPTSVFSLNPSLGVPGQFILSYTDRGGTVRIAVDDVAIRNGSDGSNLIVQHLSHLLVDAIRAARGSK